MRIGLFTDTYRPSTNGIVYVVESLKTELEALGHEVFIFCPARSIRPNKSQDLEFEDGNIIRFPSVRSGFFDDFDISLFFPRRALAQIKNMELDVMHIFTPSQIGLMGVNAAIKTDKPYIIQHCTDLYEYVEDYPAVLPGVLALVGIFIPVTVKVQGREIREFMKLWRPHRSAVRWNQHMIEKAMTILYSKADAVIALSKKSQTQLESWQDEHYRYDVTLLPNGVNAIPAPKKAELTAFRRAWGFKATDEVIGFVGRLGEEKNLPLLIEAFDMYIAPARPSAKLLFVGDFGYRETLEEMAAETDYTDRIIFTGTIDREKLGAVYASLDVFCFPSIKDTQGWVLHEAAHARLPIVLVDKNVSEVVDDGINGYYADNNPDDFAQKVLTLLASPKKRQEFGEHSKRLAARLTERKQVRKLVTLYERTIQTHRAVQLEGSDDDGVLLDV